MDVEEHGVEGSMPSFILPGIGEDLLSGEDVAWVDSCLVHQADISSNNWDDVKGALLDLIGSALNLTSPSTNQSDGNLSETESGASSSLERIVTSERPARRGSDLVLAEIENFDGDDFPSQEEPSSLLIFKNVFQPNYKEFLEDTFDWDEELKLGVHEVGLSHEEIFKVWDLNVAEEEGGLFSQLQKILAQPSPGQRQQSLFDSDDSNNWKEPEENLANFNNLVARIADLSLKDTSS